MKLLVVRYVVRRRRNGLWTVFDALSGFPASIGGQGLIGLEEAQAREMAGGLNAQTLTGDATRRSEVWHPVPLSGACALSHLSVAENLSLKHRPLRGF